MADLLAIGIIFCIFAGMLWLLEKTEDYYWFD